MQVEASVEIHLVWNDDANEWEVASSCRDNTSLDWGVRPRVYDGEAGRFRASARSEGDLERATNHDVTLADLAFMLGSGITQQAMANGAVKPPNMDRPISRALIDVIDSVIDEALADHKADLPMPARQTLRARLLPIFASVGEREFQRGRNATKTAVK